MQKLRNLPESVQILTHVEIQMLAEELEKSKPNQKQIKKLFVQSGIDYSTDPIEQMSALLNYLQMYSFKMKREKFIEEN